MEATEIPGTCALQVIHDVECLAQQGAWEQKEAKKFKELLKQGSGTGKYDTSFITGSIVTLSDFECEDYKAQVKFLKAHGFKELGSWPGSHQGYDGEYKMHLWGSKEFKLPRRKK